MLSYSPLRDGTGSQRLRRAKATPPSVASSVSPVSVSECLLSHTHAQERAHHASLYMLCFVSSCFRVRFLAKPGRRKGRPSGWRSWLKPAKSAVRAGWATLGCIHIWPHYASHKGKKVAPFPYFQRGRERSRMIQEGKNLSPIFDLHPPLFVNHGT